MPKNDPESISTKSVRFITIEQDNSISFVKPKISMTNFQMLELTNNNQKFIDRLYHLNEKGIELAYNREYQQSLQYFSQAQKLLQYAASCGRSIDRQIILKILNNQAAIYQKTWQYERSIGYVQAIIFNLKTFLNSKENKDTLNKLKTIIKLTLNESFQNQNIEQFFQDHFEKLKIWIVKKFILSIYYLQFSGLNSENQNHQIGLKYAKQSIKSFQEAFQICLLFIRLRKKLNYHYQEKGSYRILQYIKQIKQPQLQAYNDLLKQREQIQRLFQMKSQKPSSFTQLLEKYSNNQNKSKEVKYKNSSLTQIMQLKMQPFTQRILQISKISTIDYSIQEIQNPSCLAEYLLSFSVAYFTVATQISKLNQMSVKQFNFQQNEQISQQNQISLKTSKIYYIISMEISLNLIDLLTPVTCYIYKKYFEIFQNKKLAVSGQNISKIDSLKQKYKQFLPQSNQTNKCQQGQSDSFHDNTIQEYSVNVKLQLNSKQKQSKLQKLFKQRSNNNTQVNNPPPPRLNIDLSEIQSLQYGGSTTFKQNYQIEHNFQKPQIIQQEYNTKQTIKLNSLNIKKIKTVPNLSDVSSNKQSERSSKQKSIEESKFKQDKDKTNKSKSKSVKPFPQKKYSKNSIHSSKDKPDIKIRKFISPKNINRKLYQNQNSKESKQQIKENCKKQTQSDVKKYVGTDKKKIFNDKKMFLEVSKNHDKTNIDNSDRNKKKLTFNKAKKRKDFVTPLPSKRQNTSSKDQKQKTYKKQKLHQTKRINKLRKARSFQEIIHPFQQNNVVQYQSKDLSNHYNITQRDKVTKKIDNKNKNIRQFHKIKPRQNLKFTIKPSKKEKVALIRINQAPQNSTLPTEIKQNIKQIKTKQRQLKSRQKQRQKQQKQKKQTVVNKKSKHLNYRQNSRSSIAMFGNAIRMSSVQNLLNSSIMNKNISKKLKSSNSLHQLNYSSGSGYLIKGMSSGNLNKKSYQRLKSSSFAFPEMIQSITKK